MNKNNNLNKSYESYNIIEHGVDKKSFALGARHIAIMIKEAYRIGMSQENMDLLINTTISESEEIEKEAV